MTDADIRSKITHLEIKDLQDEFLSLRVGEGIPRLEIGEIRKMVNSTKADNLPGADYKFIIETKEHKLLKVSSWALWRQIAAALRKAGKVQTTLELKHPQIGEYVVRAI